MNVNEKLDLGTVVYEFSVNTGVSSPGIVQNRYEGYNVRVHHYDGNRWFVQIKKNVSKKFTITRFINVWSEDFYMPTPYGVPSYMMAINVLTKFLQAEGGVTK